MGFFSGSTTSTVTPTGKQFDFGIFNDAPQNVDTLREANILKGAVQGGKVFSDPNFLNSLIDKFTNPNSSFASSGLVTSILSQLQGRSNVRGIGGTPLTEQLQAVAPHELAARGQGLNELLGLAGIRQNDIRNQFGLTELARPTQAFGSISKNTSSPSTIAKISSVLSLIQQGTSTFSGLPSFGGGSNPLSTGSLQGLNFGGKSTNQTTGSQSFFDPTLFSRR